MKHPTVVQFEGPILSRRDADHFFDALWHAQVSFHPDDSFKGTVYLKTGERVFSDAEAARLDALMGDVFSVTDPYECAVAAMERNDPRRPA